jgi:3-oxoadipate CoA-transferase, beta subunit
MTMIKWTKDQMARRVAADIADGMVVNLGIGMPTLVANHISREREVMMHSENGVIGFGPAPREGEEDFDLINAGKQPVTLLPGGSFFHHADSFAMMRGGHLDVPAVGGAMDLAIGARRTWVMMEHTTRTGQPKLVERCTYPLTGLACVSRVYTDMAVIDLTPAGARIIDMVDGIDVEQLQARTDVLLAR